MNISLTGLPALIAIIIFLSLVFLLPVYVLSKLRRKTYEFRRKHNEIIMTKYEPPHGLSPAEVGYLTDARFSKTELFATLLDLEQRGHLRIEKQTFPNFIIHKSETAEGTLTPHEKFVVDEFSHTSSASVYTHVKMKEFKNAVIDSLVAKGLIKETHRRVSTRGGRIILIYLALNTAVTLLATFTAEVEGSFILLLLLAPIMFTPITLPLAIFFGFVYHHVVGDTSLWTKKMKDSWIEIAGYKDFVRQVELDNIQFESADLKEKTKIAALPYAVALGMDTQWEKRFST